MYACFDITDGEYRCIEFAETGKHHPIIDTSILSESYILGGFVCGFDSVSKNTRMNTYTRILNTTIQWYSDIGPSVTYSDFSTIQTNSSNYIYYYTAFFLARASLVLWLIRLRSISADRPKAKAKTFV